MADLDDFFAKKDRKKSKTTKKFTTTDDLAKKLEETSKKTEKLKKEKMTASSVPTNNLAQDIVADETAAPAFNDEDEWKEFTEEKKDYSSLKIQHLQISENDAENGDQNDSNYDGFDEEGNETQPGNRRKQGPWKMVAPQPQAQPEPEPEPKPAEEPPAAQPASGKYISPALRQAMMQEKQLQKASLKNLKKGQTPDLGDASSFPTLDQAKKAPASTSAWGKKRTDEPQQPSAVFRDSRTVRGPPSFNRSSNSDYNRSDRDYNRSDYNRSDYNRSDYNRSDRSDYSRPSDNRYDSLRDNRS